MNFKFKSKEDLIRIVSGFPHDLHEPWLKKVSIETLQKLIQNISEFFSDQLEGVHEVSENSSRENLIQYIRYLQFVLLNKQVLQGQTKDFFQKDYSTMFSLKTVKNAITLTGQKTIKPIRTTGLTCTAETQIF